jgi:glucose-6-phosphate isomerase
MIKPKQIESIITNSYEKLKRERIVQRIWEHDHTVWKPEPTEITNRLGWLHSPAAMQDAIHEITSFAEQIMSEGFTHALLLGMGGSSLAPEVFRSIFGVKSGFPDLAVLDSTTPGAVLAAVRKLNPEKTLFIASTKSGGTVETLSFLKYFYNATLKKIGKGTVGKHFIAITDPGSGLEALAKDLNFRKIFLNDPDIGGRFSALSYFGLVPAGLIGVDLNLLLERASSAIRDCRENAGSNQNENDCVHLGIFLGEFALQGRDKLTFIMSPAIEPLGGWIEQLIAESTGKEGTGIVPVIGEVILRPEDYSDDRLFVYFKFRDDETYEAQINALSDYGYPVFQIHLTDEYDVGGEFFRWEMASAIAGHLLKINPFDQPNVEAAKVLARNMVTAYQEKGRLPESEPSLKTQDITIFTDEKIKNLEDALTKFFAKANPENMGIGRSYVAIQAFIAPTNEADAALHRLRTKIQQKYRLATTVGYGPRFLHSTGQLHKGDAGNGLFIQITADNSEDAPIPDHAGKDASSMSFGVLAFAQALGDRQALLDANRTVIRFHISTNIAEGIDKLVEAIR